MAAGISRKRPYAARFWTRIFGINFAMGVVTGIPIVNPHMHETLPYRPLAWLGLAAALGGIVAVFLGLRHHQSLPAFLGSCAFLAGLLGATAALLFPDLLRASTNEAFSLTAYNSSAAPSSLRIALRVVGDRGAAGGDLLRHPVPHAPGESDRSERGEGY